MKPYTLLTIHTINISFSFIGHLILVIQLINTAKITAFLPLSDGIHIEV